MEHIKQRLVLGEDSKHQLKTKINDAEQLAEEITAFANALGGTVYVGVKEDKNGVATAVGIAQGELRKLEGYIATASADGVVPPVHVLTENVLVDGQLLVLIHVPEGERKPYHTKNGAYLTKSGAGKRVLSPEELQRMVQKPSLLFEEIPVSGSSIGADFNFLPFYAYFEKRYKDNFETYLTKNKLSVGQFLQNTKLVEQEQLTLVGLSFFGKNPQRLRPLHLIKAISFYGNDVTDSSYISSEDLDGTLPVQLEKGLRFVQQNLLKTQNSKGFNSLGDLEIPVEVLEELLVNALVHRDYSVLSSIKLFIFKDRVEIISPGVLPNHLDEGNIKLGVSIARNPILLGCATYLMPYRGIGSGILRALSQYPAIDFENSHAQYQFKVIIHRK